MTHEFSALVIDDEVFVRNLLMEVLHLRGYEVRTATTAQEGLRLFRERPCDLIMLGFSFPAIYSLDAFRHFRALDAKVGIILMPTRADETNRITGENLGAVILHKPFGIAILNTMLKLMEDSRTRWLEQCRKFESQTAQDHLDASANDRRRHLRATVRLPASVIPCQPEGRLDEESRYCQVIDISLGGGGLKFHLDTAFPTGTEVSITFPLGAREEPITLPGTVAWTDIEAGQCGAKFHDLHEKQVITLENIVVEALRMCDNPSDDLPREGSR